MRREQHLHRRARRPSTSACSISAVCRCVSNPYALHVLVRLREQARRLEPAPGAGHARHRVGDDARLDELERDERRARQAHRGRVATGRRDVLVRRDLVAVQLDEPVRERVGRVGRVVWLAVPARVHVGRQPEVGAQVDRVPDVVEQTGQQRLALAVRQRAEHQVEPGQVGGVERREPEALVAPGASPGTPRPPPRPRSPPRSRARPRSRDGPARSRSSSAPVYPDAPTTPARYAMVHIIQHHA